MDVRLALNQEVGGSRPSSPTIHAGVAQLVEHELPKLVVAGSNPVARSIR